MVGGLCLLFKFGFVSHHVKPWYLSTEQASLVTILFRVIIGWKAKNLNYFLINQEISYPPFSVLKSHHPSLSK
jgi:hypothetical protein